MNNSGDSGHEYELYDVQNVESDIGIPIKEQLIKPGLLWEDPTDKFNALRQGQDIKTEDESEWHQIRISAGSFQKPVVFKVWVMPK